jgi:hypothetical protein
MPDATDRLIAAATKPFSDNAEMQIAAENELRELLNHHREHGRSSAAEEECAAALEKDTPARRKGWTLAVIGAALLSLGIAGWSGFQFYTARDAIEALDDGFQMWHHDLSPALIAPDATPREQVLLFGDPSARHHPNQFKALWDLDPGNPAYFREYAFSHSNKNSKRAFPPDAFRIMTDIDPGNGYFAMVAACVHAAKCVQNVPPPKLKKGEKRPPLSWTIHDGQRMEESLGMLERAVAMPEWKSYDSEIIQERFKILPQAKDILARIFQASYMNQSRSGEPFLFPAMAVIGAKAEQCGKDGDVEGLRRLYVLRRKITSRLLGHPPRTLFDTVSIRSVCGFAVENLEASAESLGLEDEAGHLRKQMAMIEKSRNEHHPEAEELELLLTSRGSYQAASVAGIEPFRRGPSPGISEQDLAPGRLADYELANRAGALIGCASFAIASFLAGFYRFRSGSFARRLSIPLRALLRPSDWLWILGGVLFPFLLLEMLARFTPLGARDWHVGTHGLIVTAGQLLATLLLMLGMPLVFARWRLGKRGALLGMRRRGQWIAKPMMALCLAAIFLYGLGFLANEPIKHTSSSFLDLDITDQEGGRAVAFLIATIALGTAFVWWLLTGLRALFGSHPKMLRRLVLSRTLVPAYTFAMLLMALAIPLYHAAEKYWISRDRVMEMTVETAPLNRYSHDIAMSYHQWLRNILVAED